MATPAVKATPVAQARFECPVCKVKLKSKQALEYHASKKNACVPPGVPKHHCAVCDKSFNLATGLRQHQQGQGHIERTARAAALATENEETDEELREAARAAAQEAARLEEMLAAGCGVCGIERFSRECTMLVHNQSQRHAAAVERAARTAAAAAESAAAPAESDDSPSSDLAEDGGHSDDGECPNESGQAVVDGQHAQTADPAPHCTIPEHIQTIFEANKYAQPEIGDFIRAGLTDEQVTWYDALQVARYSVSEKYPVDLEAIWQRIGFPRKDAAVRFIKSNLTPELHYLIIPGFCGMVINSEINDSARGSTPDEYALTLEAAQHLAMGAPGKNGRQVRDMYIRVVQRVQDYEILTRLYASFESARQAHHDSVLANVTDKRCAYLSQIMLVNGEKRRKGGYTDDTPKARYTSGLKDQFGAGSSRFLFDRVAVVSNPKEVEQCLLYKSAFARHVHPVTLPNGNLTTETFSVEGMTVKQTHKEFDRIVKQYGRSAQVISEDERRETRRYEHEIEMRDRDIEVARQANRSKELDIELRKLEMGTRPGP
ncbi:g719 [Coccomyxa elongata]